MSNGSDARASGEHLSALVDGELESQHVHASCLTWREDAESRATWHAYHLIGDVLRSDDLAASAARDCDFLARLRVRLADEPVVLAPMPVEEPALAEIVVKRRVGAAGNSRWSWKAPSAVAAGFVVVAGALMVTRAPQPDASLASAGTTNTSAVALLPDSAASAFRVAESFAPAAVVPASDRQLIRDARLDRYLSAHKEFAGSTALGVPSAFVRDAVAESPSR